MYHKQSLLLHTKNLQNMKEPAGHRRTIRAEGDDLQTCSGGGASYGFVMQRAASTRYKHPFFCLIIHVILQSVIMGALGMVISSLWVMLQGQKQQLIRLALFLTVENLNFSAPKPLQDPLNLLRLCTNAPAP